jgi:hypothetical protein
MKKATEPLARETAAQCTAAVHGVQLHCILAEMTSEYNSNNNTAAVNHGSFV